MLARLFSRQNDLYDPLVVERDFNSLWNTGYFEDVRIERVDTPKCVQLVIYVREKPTIREINYKGLNAVTQSDVLERFKKAKVPLSVESQYDATKITRAEVVLKDLLAEHGHQFATVTPEIKTIPPASVAITFKIKEGPTVKVGKIEFQGNNSLNDRTLRGAMRNLKPIGIPHSIILENLFARTFDASKLDEDTERVRQAYRDRGYFKAQTSEPTTHVRDAGGLNPFTLRPSKGKRIDILMPVEEGERYKLGGITFTGNKAAPNTKALRAQFAQKDGEWFNATMFSKGLDQLRKAYGSLGYINMVGNPVPRIDEAKKLIYLDIDIDEGKQFYVSRIEFTGNTITRDKVIRRELLLEEGQVYNSQLWELSILRLNQLNYFETLKAEQDSESRQNADDGTVDLLLKLKEKGKNSIGLNGGISGLSGTFIGLNYETNNFLGLGETLSVQANVGDLSRKLSFGFTEPYLRNKPISVGAQVFTTKYDYNPSKSQSTTGADRESVEGAAVAADELQPVDNRPDAVGERAAASSVGQDRRDACRRVLLAVAVVGDDVQRQYDQRLPVAGVPVRCGRAEPAERHHYVGGHAELFVLEPGSRGRSAQRQGLQRFDADRGRGRQCEVHLADRQLSPVLPDEGTEGQSRRATMCWATACSWRTSPASAARWLRRRIVSTRWRIGSSRVRYPVGRAVHVYSEQGSVQPDESGWDIGSARSDQSCAGQRADSAADLPDGVDRRRYAVHGEPGVPHSDRQPGDVCVLHRLRHGLRRAAGPVAAEHGRTIADQWRSVWLPHDRQRRLLRRQLGQVPRPAGRSYREPTMCRACRTARSCR